MDDIQDALEGITGARSVNLLTLNNLLNWHINHHHIYYDFRCRECL